MDKATLTHEQIDFNARTT